MSKAMPRTPARLLTILEVAEPLRVSEKTIRGWIEGGELAAARLGAQWRIRPRDLDDFVRDRIAR